MNHDIYEAVRTLTSSATMRARGIDEAFAGMFAKNMEAFDLFSAEVQAKIRGQFLQMSSYLSELEGVGRKHDEEALERLAEWLKAVNALLIMTKAEANKR